MFFLLATFTSPKPDAEDPAEAKIQKLVERSAKGERTAAVQLYRLHVQRVYRKKMDQLRDCASTDPTAESIELAGCAGIVLLSPFSSVLLSALGGS